MSPFDISKKEEPETMEINGKEFTCQVCGGDKFWRTEAQLNKSVTTFFKLDWTDISAVCLVCDHCGYIHWFLPKRS